MFGYIWTMALVVLSNLFYHICAKSVPDGLNPFASLTVTYSIGAVTAFILFHVLGGGGRILEEYGKLNWAPFILGFAVVGLEVGFIYAYKVGWPVSTMQVIQAVLLAIVLIFVGYVLYKEPITWNKILGIVICTAGLGLINMN